MNIDLVSAWCQHCGHVTKVTWIDQHAPHYVTDDHQNVVAKTCAGIIQCERGHCLLSIGVGNYHE